MQREASITRKTSETKIALNLALDGSGKSSVNTSVGFLDHMLTLLAAHGDQLQRLGNLQGAVDA